jgi:hypothetical protein
MARKIKFSATDLQVPYLLNGVEGVMNHPTFKARMNDKGSDPRPQLKSLIETLSAHAGTDVQPLVALLERLNAEKAANRGGSKRTPVKLGETRTFKPGNRETRPQVVIPLPADCAFFNDEKVSVRFLENEIIITAVE